MREKGYYWVREASLTEELNEPGSGWMPAWWNGKDEWTVLGWTDMPYEDKCFSEIGERITPPSSEPHYRRTIESELPAIARSLGISIEELRDGINRGRFVIPCFSGAHAEDD